MTIIKLVLFNIISFVFFFPLMFSIASATDVMKGDNKHARIWNKFANDCLSLHEKLTDGKNLQVKNRVGRYTNEDIFYTEDRYFDEGRLVSQVQWENGDQNKLHTIEVYLHDKKGRVVRDFITAYLPFYRNAPTQTLISFHHYNAALHAFRSFDASGDTVLERCRGKNKNGQPVNLLLDEDDLYNDYDGVMESDDYNECFSGLKQNTLGKYIVPQ
ncbi:MAG: hypothetical protein OEW99_09290 [Gammaproteobacteria bacterium]|nr:hypothetical protein [Gammaproteobacteria bacterium]